MPDSATVALARSPSPAFPVSLFLLPLPLSPLRASAIFIGVYEPVKAKLLDAFPKESSVAAHLVRSATLEFCYSLDLLLTRSAPR